MRVFLAGSSGVIGAAMIPLLLGRGHVVIGTTRDHGRAEALRQIGVQPLVLDVLDLNEVIDGMGRAQPDVIMHQLTSLSRRDYAANNLVRRLGTANLVEGALAHGVQHMVAQSLALYGPGENPACESDPIASADTLSGTAGAVMDLERAVGRLSRGVILRYGTLYGPGTWIAPGAIVAEQVRRGELPISAAVLSFLHVADAARAAVVALDWPAGVVNVVDDDPALDGEWIPWLARLLDGPSPKEQAPSASRSVFYRPVSNRKARKELNWQPIYPTWRDGFRTVFSAQPVRE